MKKLIAIVLAILMAAVLFTGCVSSAGAAAYGKEAAAPERPSETQLDAALPDQGIETVVSVTEPTKDAITAPNEVYELAGFDFTFPAELAGSVEYGKATSTCIPVHYFSKEFDGYVQFAKFLDEDNAYDSIREDFYYYDHETIKAHDIEVNVLSMVNEESGVKSKTIAYWKVNEWCYEMNTHFAPNCNFDAILERFIMISLDQK